MNKNNNQYAELASRVGDHNRNSLKAGRNIFKLFYGSDPHPSEGQLDSIKHHMMMGDPLADAVVKMYEKFPAGKGRELAIQAIENGIDSIEQPPQELRDFFIQVDNEPIWLDHEKLKLACDVSRRVGPSGELVLRNLALMGGYLGAAAAKPLVFTGQLDRLTPRRLVETSKFWMDVTTVGGLGRGKEGFKSAVRVRLMHAQVRAMLVKSDKWSNAWGHPLNQWDSMATILEFSTIFLTGLRSIGFIFTKKEREAVVHLWRYIGYLMGVEECILPANEEDSMRAMYHVVATICKSDEDSKALGQALANAPYQFAEDNWRSQQLASLESKFRIGYTRYILGDEAGDQLGLPKTKTKYFWPAQAPLRMGAELVRMAIPPLNKLMVNIGEKAVKKQFPLQVNRTSADTTFTPVNQLVR